MKWHRRAGVAAALAGALALTACAGGGGASTPGGESEYEDVTIKINTGVPPTHHINEQLFVPWKEFVEAESDGHVTVELYDANTLGSLTTALSDMESGLYDLTVVVPTFFMDSGLFPLTVGNMISASPEQGLGTEAIQAYMASDAVDIEVPGVTIAAAAMTTSFQLWSKEPIGSLEDVRGVQVRVGSAIEAELITLLGGQPVQVPPAEAYQALERGTVAAAYFPVETALGFRLYEVAPNLLFADVSSTVITAGVRTSFLDGLSDPLRALFEDTLFPELQELLAYTELQEENLAHVEELEAGGELAVTEPSDADRAISAAAAEEQWAGWADQADGKGYDGAALVAEYIGLLEAAGGPAPY